MRDDPRGPGLGPRRRRFSRRPSLPGRRPRGLLPRLGLACGGLLAGLVLAELLARLLPPGGDANLLFNAPDASPVGLYLTDPEVMMLPAPGFEGTVRSLGYQVPLRINQLGLRGPEVGPKAGARWLGIGDSFTMSVQVPEAETFLARAGVQSGLELLNAGVDGYATQQATARYRALADALDLDGVILTFFLGNDLQDNERWPTLRQQAWGMARGEPIARRPLAWSEALLLRRSHLYAHWRVRRRAAVLAAGTDPIQAQWQDELSIFTETGAARLARLEPHTRGALMELRNLARSKGDRVLIAVAPPAFVVETDRAETTMQTVGLGKQALALDAPGDLVLRIAAELELAVCDLSPALKGARATGATLYLTYDGHWTQTGHAVVAEALTQCLSPS